MDWVAIVRAEAPGEVSSLLAYSDWLEADIGDDYHLESVRNLPGLVEILKVQKREVLPQLSPTLASRDESLIVILQSRTMGMGAWTIAAEARDARVFGVPAERSPRHLLTGVHPGVDVLLEAFGLEMTAGYAGVYAAAKEWFLRACGLRFTTRSLKIDFASGGPASFEVNLAWPDQIV